MSSPRERQLVEAIKNLLIGIHDSEEIYKEFSKLKEKFIRMSLNEIDKTAKKAASNVERYAVDYEKREKKKPSIQLIKKKLKQELENI